MSVSLKTDLNLIDQQLKNERPFDPLVTDGRLLSFHTPHVKYGVFWKTVQ